MATFFQYPGPHGESCQSHGFSNAVTIPASATLVKIAGQAGIDLKTGKLVEDSIAAQIEACFDCVDAALKAAGVEEGLGKVVKFVTYMLDCRNEPLMMEIWKKRFPALQPCWTCIGTSNLCLQGMVLEMDAEAIIE